MAIEEHDGGRPGFLLLLGLVVSALLCAGLIAIWPADDEPEVTAGADLFAGFDDAVPGATGEPSRNPTGFPVPEVPGAPDRPSVSLFEGGAAGAVAEVLAAAGQPSRFIELTVYPTYLFVAYVDPAQPANIDERQWRDGVVGEAKPNPIDDRVDAETEPELFTLEGVDLGIVPQLVADAATRYGMPVEITHIIVDRFLPFDERVLFRVYASPSDGRSGGGYVSYDTAGNLVRVCC